MGYEYGCVDCQLKHLSTAFIVDRAEFLFFVMSPELAREVAVIISKEMCVEEYQNFDHLIRLIGVLGCCPGPGMRDARKFFTDVAINGTWWSEDEIPPVLMVPGASDYVSKAHEFCALDHGTPIDNRVLGIAQGVFESLVGTVQEDEGDEHS